MMRSLRRVGHHAFVLLCLALVSCAPARSAMKRSPEGPMVRSLGEIRAQEGIVFQPTGPDGSPKPTAERTLASTRRASSVRYSR